MQSNASSEQTHTTAHAQTDAQTDAPMAACPAEQRRRVGWAGWIKRAVTVLAVIPLLIVLAFAGAVSLIDFNQYKPQIEKEVTERTGHPLRIEGAIGVSVWPFALSVGEVALKNRPEFAEQFGQADLLSIKRLNVELSVWQLLWHKRMVVKGLEVVEPNLVLLRTAQGDNWQRLAQRLQPGAAGDTDRAANEAMANRRHASATPDDLRAFLSALAQVSVASDAAAIELGEAQKPALPSAEALSAPQVPQATDETNATEAADVLPMDAAPSVAAWHFDSVVVTNGRFELQDAAVNQQAQITQWNLLAFNVNLGQPFKVRTDFNYRNPLQQRDYAFDLSANLHVDNGFMRWQVSDWQGMFTLRLPEEQQVPQMRLVTQGKQFSLNLSEEQVQIEAMQLESLGSRLQASFSGHYGAHANLYGAVEMQGVNLPNWARHLGVDFPQFVNERALTEVKGQLEWALHGDTLALNKIDLQLDATRLRGKWWRKAGQPVRYGYDLQVDTLNLNDYLAYVDTKIETAVDTAADTTPKKDAQKDAAQTQQAGGRATYLPLAVPISTLRAAQLQGDLSIETLQFSGWRFNKVVSHLQGDKGVVNLLPLQARLAGGEVASHFQLNVNGTTPAYRWQGDVKQLELGPLLQAAQGHAPLDGRLNADFELASQGSNRAAILANLHGSLNLKAANGHINGVDLAKLLAAQTPKAGDKTAFTSITLNAKVTQGVLQSQQLGVQASLFEAKGGMRLDLNRARVESTLQASLKNLPKGLKALSTVRVPLRYAGPVETAQWSVDLQKLLR